MLVEFRPLATLRVTHAYNDGISPDVELMIPAETAAVLRRGGMITKIVGGVLHFLYAADETKQRLVSVAGNTLRVALKLRNPTFHNITDSAALPAAGIAFWRNRTTATALDAMETRKLVGQIFVHALADAARPVTVTVENGDRHTLRTETVTAAQGRSAVSIDLTGVDSGPLIVTEGYPTDQRTTRYLLHSELERESLIGVVDLAVSESFYTSCSPPSFEVSFAARSEMLCYYLVVTNYTDLEFDRLAIIDAGFTEEGRTQIQFDKVPSSAFGGGELPISVLGGEANSQFVLFRSRALVARTERGHRKIQLVRHTDVLVDHLPQQRPEQADANLVIYISKAK